MLGAADAVYLKGDWTRRDDTLGAYLRDFGRVGVPLYEHVRGLQRDLHLLEIEAEEEPPLEPEHHLTKRGFRWINQTPYNR